MATLVSATLCAVHVVCAFRGPCWPALSVLSVRLEGYEVVVLTQI